MVARSVDVTVVYIVDDDDAVRDAFTRLLRAAGLEPHPYQSAEKFLAEVCDWPRACLLLDITMQPLFHPASSTPSVPFFWAGWQRDARCRCVDLAAGAAAAAYLGGTVRVSPVPFPAPLP